MASSIDIDLLAGSADISEPLICKLHVRDPELVGHSAVFSLVAEVEVDYADGIDEETTLYSEDFNVASGELVIQIPRADLRHYSYQGRHITMRLHTRVKVDDAILFDTKVSEEQEIRIGAKPALDTNANELIEPGDTFSFFANLKAIPAHNRVIALAIAIVGGIVMLANALIGAHDQFSPEAATWIYPQRDSDGDPISPLLLAIIGSSVLGASLFLLIRIQLRKYMRFRLAKVPARIKRGTKYRAGDLFAGTSRVPLEDVTLRIVACNLECGQYVEWRSTETETVSFQEPVRGVVLFEKNVSRIPANMPIADYFGDRMSFDPMFAALYPPAMVSDTHGIDVHWEIQLLHPQFVDQELVGPSGVMAYEDFLPA